MNSTTLTKRCSFVARLGLGLTALGAAIVIIGAGCLPPDAGGGKEGDRCNPLLSHDECGGTTLACTQPPFCPENYCCPVNGASSNPFCQTGCNGGAAAICTVNMDPDACAAAGTPIGGGAEGGATTPEAGGD
jgi:hypothetical protein